MPELSERRVEDRLDELEQQVSVLMGRMQARLHHQLGDFRGSANTQSDRLLALHFQVFKCGFNERINLTPPS